MTYFIRYKTTTGQIGSWGAIPNFDPSIEPPSEEYTTQVVDQRYDGADHYYDLETNTVVPRPVFTPVLNKPSVQANGSDLLVVTGLPNNTACELTGPIEDFWDEPAGTLELTLNIPGRYTLTLRAFPYVDVEVKFDAS